MSGGAGAPANALSKAIRIRVYARLGISWLDIPSARATGYTDPMTGRGIHSHDLMLRNGKMWSSQPKCPPCTPPLAGGWCAATTTARLPAARSAARTESITAPSVAAGQDDVGPGFGPSCSHH